MIDKIIRLTGVPSMGAISVLRSTMLRPAFVVLADTIELTGLLGY
jgi:hypothetical protein